MTDPRFILALGVVLPLALLPSPASAQDLGGVAFVVLPPVVLAPLLAAVVRIAMRGQSSGARRSFGAALACAWIELFLWLACAYAAANVWFAQRWHAPAAVLLVVAIAASWVLSGWWLGAGRGRSTLRQVLFVPVVPLSVLALLTVMYVLVVAWERLF